MDHQPLRNRLSRRAFIAGLTAFAGLAATRSVAGMPAKRASVIPLPTPDQIRRDYQLMVDFGPRLPGHPNHLRWVDWMARQFADAGLQLGPCESFAYRRWDPLKSALDIIDGDASQPVANVTHYVRSKPTGAEGVTGPLVYGGKITKDGFTELGELPKGSIVVFDGELPVTTVKKLVDPEYVHLQGQTREAFVNESYSRLWQTPHYPLDSLVDKGVSGVAIIMDVSSAMIGGNYSPHSALYRPAIPSLFVGKDVGAALRDAAKAGKSARLTLQANWVDCMVPSVTAILPGESDEAMIIDTHTDGQNFIEENGCVTLVQLARHFASLPPDKKLKRSLVFVGWPGHMSGEVLPEARGWIRDHADIMKRSAAAFTIEHLGASEWLDVPGKGYAYTGQNEFMNFAVTAGPLKQLVIDGFKKHDLPRHVIQKAPGTTTGDWFHKSGVPHMGCICGPSYLLKVTPGGEMDKLDADLAARQTALLADVIRGADKIPMSALKGADVSLGAQPVTGPGTSLRTCVSGS